VAKPSLGKRLGWRLEVLAYDFVRLLLSPFSFDQISAFGGWIVGIVGPLTRKKHIARKGLETAFPDAPKEKIDALLKAQWNNLGRTFAEFPFLHKLDVREGTSRVKVVGTEHLKAVINSDQAYVIISGHFANWEIMAMVLTQWGLNVQITYRPINNPHIDKRVRSQREAYGTRLMVPKSGPKGAKQLLAALEKRESIALMNDQKFNQGISVPFFGEPAMTAPGPTRLAISSGAQILPLSLTRDKANFVMTVHEPYHVKDSGNRAEDTANGVQKINQFMEDRIRENPAQWFWVHRRWPKEMYQF